MNVQSLRQSQPCQTIKLFRPDAVWVKAVDFPHSKKLISLRIDEDVIEFFKHTGARYQTRINAVLRSYVSAHRATSK